MLSCFDWFRGRANDFNSHLSVSVYSEHARRTSKRGKDKSRCSPAVRSNLCSHHVLTSYPRYHSTHALQNGIYYFIFTFVDLKFPFGRKRKEKKVGLWRRSTAVSPLLDVELYWTEWSSILLTDWPYWWKWLLDFKISFKTRKYHLSVQNLVIFNAYFPFEIFRTQPFGNSCRQLVAAIVGKRMKLNFFLSDNLATKGPRDIQNKAIMILFLNLPPDCALAIFTERATNICIGT